MDAHNGIINSIDGCAGTKGHGPPEIVTGGKDGCVRVWDPRQKESSISDFNNSFGCNPSSHFFILK